LVFSASSANSSVTYCKWQLELIAVINLRVNVSEYCKYEQKIMFGAEDQVPADSYHGREQKTKLNKSIHVWVVQMQIQFPWGIEMKFVILVVQF